MNILERRQYINVLRAEPELVLLRLRFRPRSSDRFDDLTRHAYLLSRTLQDEVHGLFLYALDPFDARVRLVG